MAYLLDPDPRTPLICSTERGCHFLARSGTSVPCAAAQPGVTRYVE